MIETGILWFVMLVLCGIGGTCVAILLLEITRDE